MPRTAWTRAEPADGPRRRATGRAKLGAAGRPPGRRRARRCRAGGPCENDDEDDDKGPASRPFTADDGPCRAGAAGRDGPVKRPFSSPEGTTTGRAAKAATTIAKWFTDCCWRPSTSGHRSSAHRRSRWHRANHLHVWTNSCCRWLLVLYAAVVVVASFARAAHSAKDVPVYHVRAVAGQQARLPCDISLVSDEEDDLSDLGADSPPIDGESSPPQAAGKNLRDAVLLVLWYRDDLGTPIYSVDARSSATHANQQYDSSSYHLMTTGAERWSDQRVFGDRAHFHVNVDTDEGDEKSKTMINSRQKSIITTYYSSELRIDRVGVKDAIHLYRCRVDFRLAQTRNSKVNLTVIVPPDRMEIVDLATGRQLLRRQDDGDGVNGESDRVSEASTAVVGPYVEGSDVRVRCRVYGGKPGPRVAWFRDNRLLVPEPDDPDDAVGGVQKQDVASADGYAVATVTASSSASTGGGGGGDDSADVVEVDLTLTGLTRGDLHTELTCRTWNYFYDDEEYSIVVANSGTTSLQDAADDRKQRTSGPEVDPGRWTLRQRQSSLTAVVHVDMNFPPLTVQILPIAGNGRFGGVDDGPPESPPFTQSSAKMQQTPLSGDGGQRAVHGDPPEPRRPQPLTAGRKYELPCRAYGSRPPAKLTWWMDGRRLDTTRETTSSDGNSTTSVLTFVPVKPTKSGDGGDERGASDFDGRLTCRAENPQHQQPTSQRKHAAAGSDASNDAGTPFIQSTWLLRIQYVPETQIALGTNLRADDIREGTDVYFDCTVDAVPPAYKVQWKRDGVELHHNAGGGSSMAGSGSTTTIIISNQSLVLQGVSRREAGHYTCGAENAEGPGPHSKPFYLDVLYAPTCTTSNSGGTKAVQRVVYGVAKKETVTIACHVQANPAPTEYRWSFNNTISSIATGGGAAGSSATGSSSVKQRFGGIGNLGGSPLNSSRVLTYAPRTDFDYGTVECWARNRVGMQSHPCVYHVIAAGRPDRVTNCTVVQNSRAASSRNGTRKSRSGPRSPGTHIFIRCTEGYDGGLPQRLWAEIREASKTRPDDNPELGGDDPGGDLVLNVTGVDEEHRGFPDAASPEENGKFGAAASAPVKVFVARGLRPGAVYRVDVMASNAKGRSEPLTLMVSVPVGAAGTDSDEPSNQNGVSNTMTTMEGQDPDRARNLLLEQQRELERDRRLQENGGIGDFQMTRAMAIVLMVAGSLVVIACGVATFLRYRKDDDDDDDDGDGGGGGNAGDRTAVEASATRVSGSGNKTVVVAAAAVTAAAEEPSSLSAGTATRAAGDKTTVDKELLRHNGNVVVVAAAGGGGGCRQPPTGPSVDGTDARARGPVAVVPPSPTVLRCGPAAAYGVQQPLHKGGSPQPAADPQGRAQSYRGCRNPDIIPAPLQMSPAGTVYSNYNHADLGEPAESMTLVMASSTSSSPIHNHRQQQFHQHGRYNNPGQYHRGAMTLRRPVVAQYYGGGGGAPLQRNLSQQPDCAQQPAVVMVKDASVGGAVNCSSPPTSSTSAAYCTLPRSSYHHHHHPHPQHPNHRQQQQQWLQQQQQQLARGHHHQLAPNQLEVDVVEPPPPPWPPHGAGAYPTAAVIVVPSPPLPSPPPVVQQAQATTAAGADKSQAIVNKRESAV